MTEQQNLDVVQQIYAAFGRGDMDGIINLLDPQVSWMTPGPPDMPSAGTRRGHAAVREFFDTLMKMVDISDFVPTDFLVEGNTVAVLGTDTERVKATGKAVAFRWVHIFVIQNGKIVTFEERADVSALVDELRSAQARV